MACRGCRSPSWKAELRAAAVPLTLRPAFETPVGRPCHRRQPWTGENPAAGNTLLFRCDLWNAWKKYACIFRSTYDTLKKKNCCLSCQVSGLTIPSAAAAADWHLRAAAATWRAVSRRREPENVSSPPEKHTFSVRKTTICMQDNNLHCVVYRLATILGTLWPLVPQYGQVLSDKCFKYRLKS